MIWRMAVRKIEIFLGFSFLIFENIVGTPAKFFQYQSLSQNCPLRELLWKISAKKRFKLQK